MYKNDYIAHYGIKGMRWGVRRFQNEDGSLTNAGKKKEARQQRRLKETVRDKHGKKVSNPHFDKKGKDKIRQKGKSAVKTSLAILVGVPAVSYLAGLGLGLSGRVSATSVNQAGMAITAAWLGASVYEGGKYIGYAKTRSQVKSGTYKHK